MVAGDDIAGLVRFVYESPTGNRRTISPEWDHNLTKQANPRDQPNAFPNFGLTMNENGYLILQHKGGTGSQVHDSSAMTNMSIPLSYAEKNNPQLIMSKMLRNDSRNTTKLADDPGDDANNFIDVMAWLVTAGQYWWLGSRENPKVFVTTESTA